MKLKDIGKIVTGKTPSTKQLENFSELDDKYLFVTPRDMKDNCKYIESTERYLTSFVEDKFKSQIIKKDSVCISCIGSDMGKVYMINRLGITNQQINSITDIKDICNPHYLYYYFSDKKEYLKGIASGSTMPILNKSTFENIEIDLPARNIQDKIVKILNNIDNKIELNNQTNGNWHEEKVKKSELHQHGVDIKLVGGKRNSEYFYIECKGKSYAKSAKSINREGWLNALGQIITRMDVKRYSMSKTDGKISGINHAYKYGLGLYWESAQVALRRIPKEIAEVLCLHIFSVNDKGEVKYFTPRKFGKDYSNEEF